MATNAEGESTLRLLHVEIFRHFVFFALGGSILFTREQTIL